VTLGNISFETINSQNTNAIAVSRFSKEKSLSPNTRGHLMVAKFKLAVLRRKVSTQVKRSFCMPGPRNAKTQDPIRKRLRRIDGTRSTGSSFRMRTRCPHRVSAQPLTSHQLKANII
jgi:hypothetical protein